MPCPLTVIVQQLQGLASTGFCKVWHLAMSMLAGKPQRACPPTNFKHQNPVFALFFSHSVLRN